MTAHLEALRKLKSAIDPLYAALSDEQKKTADQLMVGPMGIMGMGMMQLAQAPTFEASPPPADGKDSP